jgi:hypothetical protein
MSGGHSSLRISPPSTKIDKGARGNMLSVNIKLYAYIEARPACTNQTSSSSFRRDTNGCEVAGSSDHRQR